MSVRRECPFCGNIHVKVVAVKRALMLRNAVWAYLQCVRADFEREQAATDTPLFKTEGA